MICDKMETHEIHNLGIQELVTTSFSVDWSSDNQISLMTIRGIHIFELQPNPLCVTATAKFKRSFIYPSDILPSAPFIGIIDSLLITFDRADLYSAMLDEGLTPKLADKEEIIPRIVAVAWSPIELFKPSKCVLGVLTSAGTVDLVVKSGINWYSVVNLTDIWWNIVKNDLDIDPKTIKVDSLDATTFRRNLRRLQATAITWSELYQSKGVEPFSYFVTAYRSCDLVIWKIERMPEFPTEMTPVVINRFQFKMDARITKLLWIRLDMEKYLIIIGFHDGRIYCLDENLSEKDIVEDVDRMPVNFMKELSRTHNEINVVVIKSFFLIVMTLDHRGKLLRQKHAHLPAFPITGIQLISENYMIVTTQDAKMYRFKLDERRNLVYEPINCDLKTSNVQFLGLARSPSGVTFINITAPSGLYDHLVNREPTTLQMFGFKGEMWDPWNVLRKNETHIQWDCFELIRMKAAKETESENYLPSVPDKLENLSIHQLRNIMWLTLIRGILKQKKIMKKIDNVIGEISEAQPLIFVHAAASYMILLSKKQLLTDDMRLCIHFLRLYLEVFLAGEEDDDDNNDGKNVAVKQAEYALTATENVNLIEVEKCNLCGKAITELPWNTASCPDGHQLPRCALTLLQITCLKYRSCPVCARIFHPILDEDYEDVRCLYCDVSAEYDNRVIGVNDEFEEKCKNLSIRPIWVIQGNKSQESETSAVDEKRSKKRRTATADTFTVVVNKNDETITETWQEL